MIETGNNKRKMSNNNNVLINLKGFWQPFGVILST